MLNENDYFKMVLDVLKDNATSQEVSEELCSKVIMKIRQRMKEVENTGQTRVIDTQEICDDVFACFDYYNDFVTSKNIDVALVEGQDYSNIILAINFAVEVIKSGEY